MTCQRCKSERIMEVNAKCSDLCAWKTPGMKDWADGYVPEGSPIYGDGCGDYVDFSFCLGCGQVQGEFPSKFNGEPTS